MFFTEKFIDTVNFLPLVLKCLKTVKATNGLTSERKERKMIRKYIFQQIEFSYRLRKKAETRRCNHIHIPKEPRGSRSFYFTLRCDRIQQPSYFYQIKEILSNFSRETKDLVLNKLVNKLYLFDVYIFFIYRSCTIFLVFNLSDFLYSPYAF